MRTTVESSGAFPRQATAQGEAERHLTPAGGILKRQSSAWTYASPTTRQPPGGSVEIRRELKEFRSAETVKEHASSYDLRPPFFTLQATASIPSSLSDDLLTVLAGGAGGSGRTIYDSGGRATALLLQHLRTSTVLSGTRERSVTVHARRLLEHTSQQQTQRRATGTREVLSSIHTFVERAHTTLAGITHAGYSTVFTRPGFKPALRRGFEQVSARQRGATNTRESAPGYITSRGLVGRPVELVRHSSFTELRREASTRDAGTQIVNDRASSIFTTQGATGAGTFLFSTGLLRKSAGASTAGALSRSAVTAGASSETRAARPEGMALELIRHRREEVLRLPQPGYVFTQPARAQLEERQVITKASREEIVEVVRKEVRALGVAAPASPATSRADLAGLADEVYSTLVRRLLVEKERLGR
jgi:hypothetical protein